MIIKYDNFIFENSKNDPIPELNDIDKLCIILMGTPGSGKTYFSNNYIKLKKDIKSFSSDDLKIKIKDHDDASRINVNRILTFMKTNQSFIYDTTGSFPVQVLNIVNESRDIGYKVIFIHIMTDLETSHRQNQQRDRVEDKEFVDFSYHTQYKNMSMYYNKINPDSYYVITNMNGKYKFYKYTGDKLLKRKLDKYVEKYDSHSLLSDLKRIQGGLSNMKRQLTPYEIFEDYFLEFKESLGYKVDMDGKKHNFYVLIQLCNLLDVNNIEEQFNQILGKLITAKNRLVDLHGFNCHFQIKLNGKDQCDWNPETIRNDDYKFKGIGDRRSGYDGKGNYYSDYKGGTDYPELPEDKVAISIKFYAI